MVTGASTADLALVLVDARKGVLEQSRRHAFLASLLGIPHLVLCVNKMDLVDWDQDRFEEIRDEFTDFATRLDVHDLTFIPISALHGDNVVHRSEQQPWYEGPTLLHHLEDGLHRLRTATSSTPGSPCSTSSGPRRREHHDYRGYAGTVASGVLRPGRRGHGPARRARPPRIAAIDGRRRRGGRGVPAHGGHRDALPTTSTCRGAT